MSSNIPDFIKTYEEYGEHVILNPVIVDDGEGGMITVWTEGAHFFGAVVLEDSPEMLIAQAQGVQGKYSVTVDKKTRLPWHTVFRRLADGAVFRITTKDETVVPKNAPIDMRALRAEEWTIPDE